MSLRACIDFCAAAQNSLSDRLPTFGISLSITNLGIVHSISRLSKIHLSQEQDFILDIICSQSSQSSIPQKSSLGASKSNVCDYNGCGGRPQCPLRLPFRIGLFLAPSRRSAHLVYC